MMAFAYALALATRFKDQLSMLDWGGGIGHYYLLAQALLPGVKIEYHCKDVPILCEHGAQLFPNQYFSSDDSCFERSYDFVLASTSMHYTENWQGLLQRLTSVTSHYLYISNLPCIEQANSFVFVQRPYPYGYKTEYLGWCLNRTQFLQLAKRSGLDLMREFVYGYQPLIHGAPEQNSYRGFLFRTDSEKKHEPRNR
jgi:putative methyltransferase (TIGR04325 family)